MRLGRNTFMYKYKPKTKYKKLNIKYLIFIVERISS